MATVKDGLQILLVNDSDCKSEPAGDCTNDNYVKEGCAFFFMNAVGNDEIVLIHQLVKCLPDYPLG
ncbi:MAG: hypothetical protein K9H61_11725 [Bacteroidia bacterium]|nr:hypothetical protein [Bacteroidia bacterium]MCF8447657.1 hypothetical protein [Bacteroidia bacterium]